MREGLRKNRTVLRRTICWPSIRFRTCSSITSSPTIHATPSAGVITRSPHAILVASRIPTLPMEASLSGPSSNCKLMIAENISARRSHAAIPGFADLQLPTVPIVLSVDVSIDGAPHWMQQVVHELLAAVVPVAAEVRHRLEPVGEKGPAQFPSGLLLPEPDEMLEDAEANGLPEGGAEPDTSRPHCPSGPDPLHSERRRGDGGKVERCWKDLERSNRPFDLIRRGPAPVCASAVVTHAIEVTNATTVEARVLMIWAFGKGAAV